MDSLDSPDRIFIGHLTSTVASFCSVGCMYLVVASISKHNDMRARGISLLAPQ